jgi:hypothetical protein
VGTSTERLVSLCKSHSATTYLSGAGGKRYQEETQFNNAGIALQYSDFIHPHYPQQGCDFKMGLSIIDALFNVGPQGCQSLISKCLIMSMRTKASSGAAGSVKEEIGKNSFWPGERQDLT